MAKAIQSTRVGVVKGKPGYLSPEQLSGVEEEKIDGRADLFALGTVLLRAAHGGAALQGRHRSRHDVHHVLHS